MAHRPIKCIVFTAEGEVKSRAVALKSLMLGPEGPYGLYGYSFQGPFYKGAVIFGGPKQSPYATMESGPRKGLGTLFHDTSIYGPSR